MRASRGGALEDSFNILKLVFTWAKRLRVFFVNEDDNFRCQVSTVCLRATRAQSTFKSASMTMPASVISYSFIKTKAF